MQILLRVQRGMTFYLQKFSKKVMNKILRFKSRNIRILSTHSFLSVFSHPSSSQSELIRLQLTFAGSASTGFRYVFICLSVAFSCAAAFLRFPAFPTFPA